MLLEPKAGGGAVPHWPHLCRAHEVVDSPDCQLGDEPRLLGCSPRYLVSVLWILATRAVGCVGYRVRVAGHSDISVCSEGNPTTLGLSVVVFSSSWSSSLTLQSLC